MAVVTARRPQPARSEEFAPLENGDRLDQPTFHRRYEAMPEPCRAELVGGLVFMASPVGRPHGRAVSLLCRWLSTYEEATPGTEVLADVTVIMGPESEPEPDLLLRVLPEAGGATRDEEEFVAGPPELLVEVGSSTESIDLHLKKDDYERAGVREYLVALLRQQEIRWFVLHEGAYARMDPDADGIFRSRAFPGLWLDANALFSGDLIRLRQALDAGIASAEHAAWVRSLSPRRERKSGDR